MEAWLSSSVTDARIASLDSMRTQLSAPGWRFQEPPNGTCVTFRKSDPIGWIEGLPNGIPKGTLKGDPTVKVVLSRPLDLIWVVLPSGISLHFLDFRSGAEIRRPPAQIRRHPAWISCGPLYNALHIEGPCGGPGTCFWNSEFGILVHPIPAKYEQDVH